MAAGRGSLVRLLRFLALVLVLTALVAFVFLRLLPALRGGAPGTSGRELRPDGVLSELDDAVSLAASKPQDQASLEAALTALNRLSRRSVGVEGELSVLKRYRRLSVARPEARGAYLSAARAAEERFPAASALTALVVDAALHVDPATPDSLEALRSGGGRLDPSEFPALSVLARSRAGAYSSPPEKADRQAFLRVSSVYSRVDPAASRSLALDAALLALLNAEPLAAEGIGDKLLSDLETLSPRELLFLGELAYDFGDPLRAAALFSRLEGPEASYRRGDSYALAGRLELARSSWLDAAASGGDLALACLYNVATSTPDREEALSYLRRLRSLDSSYPCGAVLYARLLGGVAGHDALEEARKLRPSTEVELELLRVDSAPGASSDLGDRAEPRAWMLFNSRPGDPLAARWLAWFLASRGDLEGATDLMAEHGRRAGESPDTLAYAGLKAALSGQLDRAEELFQKAAAGGGDWTLAANLAALALARRQYEEALSRFTVAARLCPSGPPASALFARIASVQLALGRETEARRSLQRALELDSDNRSARRELRRLGGL